MLWILDIPSSKMSLSPVQCKSLWRQFKAETEYTLSKRSNGLLPPAWAIVAMLLLGFNEIMTLTEESFVFGRTVCHFPGGKSSLGSTGPIERISEWHLSSRLVPTVTNLLGKLAEQGQATATGDSQRNPSEIEMSSSTASSRVSGTENGTEHSSSSKND
ncbi:ROOT HAIR DEFECTIVE 3-like protein [Drosera capensis]